MIDRFAVVDCGTTANSRKAGTTTSEKRFCNRYSWAYVYIWVTRVTKSMRFELAETDADC